VEPLLLSPEQSGREAWPRIASGLDFLHKLRDWATVATFLPSEPADRAPVSHRDAIVPVEINVEQRQKNLELVESGVIGLSQQEEIVESRLERSVQVLAVWRVKALEARQHPENVALLRFPHTVREVFEKHR